MTEEHKPLARARSKTGALALAMASIAASAGCGAKTGLLVPDASFDARFDAPEDRPDVPDASDVMDAGEEAAVCVPSRATLERRGAEIVLVIDRSNSMAFTLDGNPDTSGQPTRWAVLRDALSRVLPPFERTVSFGAKFYPQPVRPTEPDLDANCRVLPGVELAPALSNASALLRFFDTTAPGGGTPTFEGLSQAITYLRARPGRGSARYIVLATDGGPNCNVMNPVPPSRCVCTSSDVNACRSNPRIGVYNCLDADRTIQLIRSTATPPATGVAGIPTYVVGLDGSMTTRTDLLAVLDDMARAGGRPRPVTNPGDRAYYSVRNPTDLERAFRDIVAPIARCAFVTPQPPTDPDALDVEVNGAVVPRDPTRVEGWEWTDRAFGEVTFYGAACDRAASAGAQVQIRQGCRDQ